MPEIPTVIEPDALRPAKMGINGNATPLFWYDSKDLDILLPPLCFMIYFAPSKILCNFSEPEDIQDALNLNQFQKYKKVIETEQKRFEEKRDEKILTIVRDVKNRLDATITTL